MNDVAEKAPGDKGGSLIAFEEKENTDRQRVPPSIKDVAETNNRLVLLEGVGDAASVYGIG